MAQDRRRQVPGLAAGSIPGAGAPLNAATPPAPVDINAVLADAAELNIVPVQQEAQSGGSYIPVARELPDMSNDNNENNSKGHKLYKQMRAARGEGLGAQRGQAMRNQQKAMQQAAAQGRGGPFQPLNTVAGQQTIHRPAFAF